MNLFVSGISGRAAVPLCALLKKDMRITSRIHVLGTHVHGTDRTVWCNLRLKRRCSAAWSWSQTEVVANFILTVDRQKDYVQLMKNWKIDSSRTDGPEGFPHAIVGAKQRIVAWVADKNDARAIIAAEQKIDGLTSDLSRHRRLWLGSLGGRSRSR